MISYKGYLLTLDRKARDDVWPAELEIPVRWVCFADGRVPFPAYDWQLHDTWYGGTVFFNSPWKAVVAAKRWIDQNPKLGVEE